MEITILTQLTKDYREFDPVSGERIQPYDSWEYKQISADELNLILHEMSRDDLFPLIKRNGISCSINKGETTPDLLHGFSWTEQRGCFPRPKDEPVSFCLWHDVLGYSRIGGG